jgi:hypothetical protein
MANSHDYIISNATGSTVRADLNTLFLEVEASNAGDSAPSNVAAGKLWMDTTTDTLKYYTGAEWVSIVRQVKGSANNTHITGNINPTASATVSGVSTVFTKQAKVGDKLVVSGETRTITAIASDTSLTVDVALTDTADDASPEIHPAAFVVTDDGGGIDLLVDTDGQVGVNCATPGAQVDIRGVAGTGAGSAGVLRLSTAELTVADADQLGRIEFIAPLEASGTDAILVGASIYAEADATFAADNNATELVFATGASETATERMRIESDGSVRFAGTSNQGFASGTKMLFNQTAAPTGWTKVTSANDVALRLTSGTVGTGGSVAFETAFASQTVPVHTLATSEIPAHTHSYEQRQAGVYAASGWAAAIHDSGANSTTTSSSTGGGGSHGHGSIDLNVSYVDVIIATKD